MARQTTFSAEYVLSLLAALLATYGVTKANPALSPLITYFLVPLAIAYISLQLLNAILPGLNTTSARVSAYVENKTLGEINSMGYVQIFPPLLAITVIVFVLLFTQRLT